MALYRPPDAFSRKLGESHEKLLGIFDTKLLCNCGKANIMDHATSANPHASPRSLANVRFGPGPDHQEQLRAFRVYHQYWCNGCGAVYKAKVIESSRGYVPLDRTPEGQALRNINPADLPDVKLFSNLEWKSATPIGS